MVAWLVGLAIISWLGDYPAPSAHAGNLAVLGFGWAMVVVAVFSAFVMWLATTRRLPAERVLDHLKEPVVAREVVTAA